MGQMGILGEMKGIYSRRRLMEKERKPKKCKKGSRGLQKEIWERGKKDGRRTQRNAGKIHGKNAI